MAGLCRVGLVGVVVVLVGAVLVVIHLAPISLSSLLTYVSRSRLCALVNYGTLSLHYVKRNAQSLHLDGTLSLHSVKRNAQSLYLDVRSVFTPETKNLINILFYFTVVYCLLLRKLFLPIYSSLSKAVQRVNLRKLNNLRTYEKSRLLYDTMALGQA
jgi:hypothetical protein